MKAIVKFLPVDGERYPLARGSSFKKEGIDTIFPAEMIDGKPHGYPVKPFAVTKDIEVGDDVFYFYDNPNKHPFTYKADAEKVDYNKNPIGSPNVYVKVLGELSQDAIWVKDGDEIEVQSVPDAISKPIKEITGYNYVGLEVRCPTCNTYH